MNNKVFALDRLKNLPLILIYQKNCANLNKKIYVVLVHPNFALKILMNLSTIQDMDYDIVVAMLKIRSYYNFE